MNNNTTDGDYLLALPAPQDDLIGDNRWMSVHNRYKNLIKSLEPEVIFLGDSHIAYLEQCQFYRENFAPLHSLCLGMSRDTTLNLHWRILDGELETVKPKIIVILIGTNDTVNSKAGEILFRIKSLVELISKKQPQATLLILKIPPRGEKPNRLRHIIEEINSNLAEILKTIPKCHVLDIDPGFVGLDGTISHQDMYDYLHFTNDGYSKAFENVLSTIVSILNPDNVG